MGRTELLAICISAVAFLAYTIMEIYEKIRNEERKRKKAKENVIAIVRAILFVAGVPASVILWVPHHAFLESFEKFKIRNETEGQIKEYIAGLCRLDELQHASSVEVAAKEKAIEEYRKIKSDNGEEDEMSAYYGNGHRGLSVLCLMKQIQVDYSISESRAAEMVAYCKELLKQRLY